jgi:hypothetical protein
MTTQLNAADSYISF